MNVNVQRVPQDYYHHTEDEIFEMIADHKRRLGPDLLILGHHYQRASVIRFADVTGDSLALAHAARDSKARHIVFCGVHFMAESADIVTSDRQTVTLPDIDAGCSMADMAPGDEVETAWEELNELHPGGIVPITYINSAATIKEICGRNGGATCTSTNARGVFEWGFEHGEKILFMPDEHLGRNTAYKMGIPLDEMVVYDPKIPFGGLTEEDVARSKMILWKGNCSVHQRFRAEHVDGHRAADPSIKILVHPECCFEVVQKADLVGSTNFIIKTIAAAPAGSSWAVGTELNLVHRLIDEYPDRRIQSLAPDMCLCATMYRTSPQALLYALEKLLKGEVINQIKVDEKTAHWARVALDRMMAIAH